MTHQDIIAHLCQPYPPQIVHEISTKDIISEIVRRNGGHGAISGETGAGYL